MSVRIKIISAGGANGGAESRSGQRLKTSLAAPQSPAKHEDKVLGTEAVSSGRNVQILFRDFKNTEMFEMAEYYLF